MLGISIIVLLMNEKTEQAQQYTNSFQKFHIQWMNDGAMIWTQVA
jgi:hypothetical protein